MILRKVATMVSLERIENASRLLQGRILSTPLVHSPTLSRMFHADVYLKLENLQKTGSFKIRGATYKISRILNRIGAGGVVAASAGNHAQGVALAASQANVPATIVMPKWASITKQEATRGYGGEVVICGDNLAESLEEARRLARQGRTFIHPYDDEDIIAGQGTIGLEILRELPNPDLVLVPVGGGGLISGIASAIKALRPATRVIGVEAKECPSAYESLRRGKRVNVAANPSLADGISVKQPGEVPFAVLRTQVDEVVLVEEEQIAAAILMLLERKKVLAEGAGAVGLAALLQGEVKEIEGRRVVLVVSGGNVDSPLLGRVLRKGLIKKGRVVRLSIPLQDVPGALARLLRIVARLQANVLHIYHDRSGRNLPVYATRVELEVETRGHGHVRELLDELGQAGYEVDLL